MRSIRCWLLMSILLVMSSAVAEDEPAQPYAGYLPMPGGHASGAVAAYHAALIVDDETGLPVAGATLTGYDEDLDPRRTRYAPKLCSAVADAHGIAWMKSPGPELADHWLAQAPGYAPAYSFGYRPPTVFRLVRGVRASGQIVDVLGRPLANLELELFCGCPHGPTVATVRTDAEGRVRLPPTDPETLTQVWCVPPRGRAQMWDPYELAEASARGFPFVLQPGRTLRGRVVDAAGAPVVDAVVRSGAWQDVEGGERTAAFTRGPTARTGTDGRFVLPGISGSDERDDILVFAADGRGVHRPVPGTREPQLRIVIDHEAPRSEAEDGFLVLRAVHPDGGFRPQLPQVDAVRDDGLGSGGLAATPGFTNELAPGLWTVFPAETFAGATFAPFEVQIVADQTTTHDVLVWQQPRTALSGVRDPIPSLGEFQIATAHAVVNENILRVMEGLVQVPRDVPVSLRYEFGTPVPLGAASAGRRTAHATAPAPARPVVVKGAPGDVEVKLIRDGVDIDSFPVDDGQFHTACVGRFEAEVVSRVEQEGAEDEQVRVWRVMLDLTAPGAGTIDLNGRKPVRGGTVRISFRTADRTVPADARVTARPVPAALGGGASGDVEVGDTFDGPCRLRLSAPLYQPIVADLAPGDHTLVWPAGALTLTVFNPEGKRVPCMVWVDGALHRDRGAEPFKLRGLAKGTYDVIVTPLVLRWRGVRLRVDIGGSDTHRRVTFSTR